MTLISLVCCVSAVLLVVSPSMGRELPIGQLAAPSISHHNVHHHAAGHHRAHPKSCLDVPHRASGVYSIQPEWPFRDPILVYCDQEYETGGWAVIQRRFDGKLSFERPEMDYRYGFGNLDGEFWLGLENIYRLLNEAPHELLVLLEDFNGNTSYARYDQFEIQKSEYYKIPQYTIRKCESYQGTAGNGWPLLIYNDAFKRGFSFSLWQGDKR
ncbi:AGAP004917-PA-like protein [Anopheles sinensis]|uniref:AGAP004917-PA-like protein n=1 Tax=Anopheles sinensis TaxID=74873 RepID=A0A084WCU9_ANOSI|nr:AGAP004917-PA-like protein [Anopheles sinensis]